MSKKALIIVGLAAVIAASTGVVFASNSNAHPRGADGDPITASQTSDVGDTDVSNDSDIQEAGAQSEETLTDETVVYETLAPEVNVQFTQTEQTGEAGESGSSLQILPSASYSIKRVLDRSSGEEQSPQLVFGKYYGSCYLTLYNDCTAEICLSPSTGKSEKGSYSIYGNTMYVDFGDDRMAQYTVDFGENNTINYIIVTSGEYDVYFG